VILQQGAVHPLSQAALTVDQQAQHVAAVAMMGADRTAVPFDDGGSGERRQDHPLASGALTLHIDEHGQVIQGEVQHGGVSFELS